MASIQWNSSAVNKIKKELGDKLELVGQYVEGEAIKNINEMRAVDSGRLKNSITHETDKDSLITRIGTNVEYAPFVCYGTIKMQPRPFLRLALYTSEKKIEDILSK